MYNIWKIAQDYDPDLQRLLNRQKRLRNLSNRGAVQQTASAHGTYPGVTPFYNKSVVQRQPMPIMSKHSCYCYYNALRKQAGFFSALGKGIGKVFRRGAARGASRVAGNGGAQAAGAGAARATGNAAGAQTAGGFTINKDKLNTYIPPDEMLGGAVPGAVPGVIPGARMPFGLRFGIGALALYPYANMLVQALRAKQDAQDARRQQAREQAAQIAAILRQ